MNELIKKLQTVVSSRHTAVVSAAVLLGVGTALALKERAKGTDEEV